MGLYFVLLRAQISAQAQYRTSFGLQVLGHFLATFTDFIVVLLLFQPPRESRRSRSSAGATLPVGVFGTSSTLARTSQRVGTWKELSRPATAAAISPRW